MPATKKSFIRIGPGGGGGQLRPAIHPTDPDVLFITCDMTGWYQSLNGGKSWRNINLKGVVRSSAYDLRRPRVIYAGNSGLYRSEDLGRSWALIFPDPAKVTEQVEADDHAAHRYISTDNWPGGLILGIAVDPDDSDVIHLAIYRECTAGETSAGRTGGTGSPNAIRRVWGPLPMPRRGELLIFSSRDCGKSFEQLAQIGDIDPRGAYGDNHAVKFLHVDADSPRENRRLLLATPNGLYRVAGVRVAGVPPMRRMAVSAMRDSMSGVEGPLLPDGAEMIDQAAIGRDATSKRPVIYITAPARRENIPAKMAGGTTGETPVGRMGKMPMLHTAGTDVLRGGVYRTDDAGDSWTQINHGLLDGLYTGEGQAPMFTCIATCATNPSVVYVECRNHPERPKEQAVWGNPYGIFKTTDGGASWSWCYRCAWDERALNNVAEGWIERWMGPGWSGTAIQLGVAPSDPDIVWRATAQSSSRSLDGGKTWIDTYCKWLPDGSVATNGMDVTTCYGVHFDPHVPGRMFISYTDISLWLSYNRGRSWWLSKGGIPLSWRNTCYWMAFDPEVRDRMWSVWSGCHDLPRPKMFQKDWSRRFGGVAFSGDGGRSWHPTTTGMPDDSVPTHIVLDPDSPPGARRLYVAAFNRGVYRSDNDARSWRLCNGGIDDGNLNAWRLALARDGTLYCCIARGGEEGGLEIDGAVYVSRDRAESWTKLPLPPGVNAPNDLAIDPRDPKRLYLAAWPRNVDGRPIGGGVWGSGDGGKSWKKLLDDHLHCYAVTIDPARPGRLYVCGFNSGVFRSNDGGKSWRKLEGYDFKWGHRVICDPEHPGMIYVTTFGGSVFYGPG